MEIIERVSIDDVRNAKPEMIYYGANTCWWTHDPNHLRVNGRIGPPPGTETPKREIVPYAKPTDRPTVNPGSIPTDPRGGVLFQTDDVEGFLKAAEEEASKSPNQYGKHGLRAFMAAHHSNCVRSLEDPRPWCSDSWTDYNDAIDRLDLRKKSVSVDEANLRHTSHGVVAFCVCPHCWQLYAYYEIHNWGASRCRRCGKGTCVEVATPNIPDPLPGSEIRCMLCKQFRPWSIFSASTGEAVCRQCTFAAQLLMRDPSTSDPLEAGPITVASDGTFSFTVSNKQTGSVWKHTIRTEEE